MGRTRKILESAERAAEAEEMLEREHDQKIRSGILHVLKKESSIMLKRALRFWIALRLRRNR